MITQLFYDTDHFLRWYQKVRAKGQSPPLGNCLSLTPLLGITIPVIPGIMPIQTYSSFTRITKLCGARIPEALADKVGSISVSLLHLMYWY